MMTERSLLRDELRGKNVLVVDDDSLFRKMLSEILVRAGLAVETAVDGEEALRLIRSGRSYDLIVSDIEMPNVDGIELVGEVGRMPGGTKIVLVTGSTIDFVPGAEAVISKSNVISVLMDEVKRVLAAEK